jgi:hypothetical protein
MKFTNAIFCFDICTTVPNAFYFKDFGDVAVHFHITIDINPLAVVVKRMRLFLSLLSEAISDDYKKIDDILFEVFNQHIACADTLLDDPFGCLQNRQKTI